jgi:hypothetical protein
VVETLEDLIAVAVEPFPIGIPVEVGQTAFPIAVLIAVTMVPYPLPRLRYRTTTTLVALVRGAPAPVLARESSAALVQVESNTVPLRVDSPVLEEAASAVGACEEAAAVDAIGNGQVDRLTT